MYKSADLSGKTDRVKLAAEAARRGLDFLVRTQVKDEGSADHGRFTFIYDCEQDRTLTLTTNWTTAVGIEAMLMGYRFFGSESYLDAARRAVAYIYSLQEFSPMRPRVSGAFHEETPQSRTFHPRDALTAAWALWDWAELMEDAEARERAIRYADWFVASSLDGGYPRWTVGFDGFDVAPRWYGSFHSGSAAFMARLYTVLGTDAYREMMQTILRLYNDLLLDDAGRVHVIADIRSRSILADSEVSQTIAPVGWIRMHEYNDDFGALANMMAWQITGDVQYMRAAERFLSHMLSMQREDGGYGPHGVDGFSVPPAGGSVLLELLAARALGSSLPVDTAIEATVDYILGLQVMRPDGVADGAFRGYTDSYTLDPAIANIRTGGYAIMALLRYAGATGPIYFPSYEATDKNSQQVDRLLGTSLNR